MKRIFNQANASVMALLALFALGSASATGAAAQEATGASAPLAGAAEPSLQTALFSDPSAPAEPPAPTADATATLAELVAAQPESDALSPDLDCLARAIYFEAGHESLAGQLAVGRVIIARTHSGRFPDTYCGVVYQPSQFSWVHHRAAATVRHDSAHWHNAVAIARIADAGTVRSEAEGALFFHAARVSPHWHLQRIAQVDNHIFFR